MLRQVAKVLAHLPRPGGAVDADDVGPQCLQRRQRGADLGARQHATGQLHRHLHLERHVAADARHGPPAGDHRCLGRQQVEHRLHDQQVDAAFQQPFGLLLVDVAELGEADLA